MNALSEIQHDEMLLNLEMILRSDRVFEKVYDAQSPEVIRWTNYFYKRANIDDIFNETWTRLNCLRKLNAEVVGTFWHHFSAIGPQMLSMAASKVSNNLIRHYIVQILFEELGGRSHRLIHPDLFLDCLSEIDINDSRREELVRKYLSYVPFDYLLRVVTKAPSDSHIIGILLGFEINAEENIKTIYDALCFDERSKEVATKSTFFRIHNVAEKEHIRLNVSNFLRFCPTERNKKDFTHGFDEGVLFWKMFWDRISFILDVEMKL